MSSNWTPIQSHLEAGLKGLTINDISDDTKLCTVRRHVIYDVGKPISEPIVNSSTYRMESVKEYQDVYKKGGYLYLRYSNPTCEAAELAIRLLEGGAGSVVFGCGMAAITTALLSFLKAGDHLVACNPLYSGTHHFMTKILPLYNIEATLIDGYDIADYRKAIKPNTKVLYGETPSNPLLSITDLTEFGKLGESLRSTGLVTMVDSTFASPYLQKPLQYGIDLVIHSATKYLGGHTDLVAGAVTTRTVEQWSNLMVMRRVFGGVLSPFDASLLLRGIKTLHVRITRQCTTAHRLAEFLESHPSIQLVHYPGLKSHPGHDLAKRQMKLFGGMITFVMKGGLEAAQCFVESVRLFALALSLGGVESLVEHPATMTHGPMIMSAEDRKESHINDGFVRMSVGLEDHDDLLADIKQALDKASKS